MARDNEKELSHPSYGCVQFSRRQGSPGRLFASPLHDHGSYVAISIGRARLIRDDRHDWHYGGLRGELIEVEMSAAQFAELLTTMNVSSGVPCTISYVNSQKVERPPEILHETEKIKNTFKEEMTNLVKNVRSSSKEIAKTLAEKKNLVKDDRERITKLLEHIALQLESNLPYTLECFNEATEKVVQHAKAEVDAFVTANVVAAGLKNLLGAAQEPDAPQLPPAEPNERQE